MKKTLALLFAITMVLTTAVGCSKDDTSSKASPPSSMTDSVIDLDSTDNEESADDFFVPTLPKEDYSYKLGEAIKTEKSMYEELVKNYNEGNFSYAYSTEDNSYIFYESSDKNHTFHWTHSNKKLAVLKTNGETYIIDIAGKKYCKGEEGDYSSESNIKELNDAYMNGQYVRSYEITYNGEKYIAELVKLDILNGNGAYFVFDDNGDAIAYISTNVDGSPLVTSLRLSDADVQNFEIPSGYTEISRDDMIEYLGGELQEDAYVIKYNLMKKELKDSDSKTIQTYYEEEPGVYGFLYMTTDSKNTYLSIEYADGSKYSFLNAPSSIYALNDDSKQYVGIQEAPEEVTEILDMLNDLFEGIYEDHSVADIEGKDYDCETVINGDETYRFLFDETGECVGLLTEDDKTLPASFSAEADTSKFQLPSDYTEYVSESEKPSTDTPEPETPDNGDKPSDDAQKADSQYAAAVALMNGKQKNVTIFDFDSNIYYAMYTTDGNNTYTSIDTDDGEFAVLELDEKIYLMDEENSKYYPLESVPDAIADKKADIEMYFSGTYKGKGDIGEWYISESAETAEIVTINGKDFLFTFDVAGNIHDIIRPELNEYGEKREVSISYEPEAVDIYLYIPSYYELMTEKEYMTYIEKMPK